MAREAKAKEASCCEDRIIVTGAVIRHSTCKESKIDEKREREKKERCRIRRNERVEEKENKAERGR